ncbi:MAG: 30S ribosomal protein S3 [Puniceicoccales bacterium]|jgi:small subunit ribosomal protein S3|nr:30S ribosomal protein S3 [Puniceicoccales bacterium]
MGQKVNPIGFRLSVQRNWQSRWYGDKKSYPVWVYEDFVIRQFLFKQLRFASIAKVFIERAGGKIRIKVHTPRPGVVLGRKGQDLELLCAKLKKKIGNDILVDVQEVKRPELVARLVAEGVASQLERRIPFRRAIKKAVQISMAAGAQGVKIQCSGRLGGAEIARTESRRDGSMPLHELRKGIDYALVVAETTYGTIGVKCWLSLYPQERESLHCNNRAAS